MISAPQLAIAVGVSESTITRAAQTLGFAGFSDLQQHLREQFVAPLQERLEPLEPDTLRSLSIAKRVMLDGALHIQEMAEDLVASEAEAVVTTLIAARRVLVFGERGAVRRIGDGAHHEFLEGVGASEQYLALVGEVPKERALGEPRSLSDLRHGGLVEPVLTVELQGCLLEATGGVGLPSTHGSEYT